MKRELGTNIGNIMRTYFLVIVNVSGHLIAGAFGDERCAFGDEEGHYVHETDDASLETERGSVGFRLVLEGFRAR